VVGIKKDGTIELFGDWSGGTHPQTAGTSWRSSDGWEKKGALVRSAPAEAPAVTRHRNPVIEAMTAAQFGTPDQIADVETHMKEYFERWPNYKSKLTHLEWYHLFLDFHDYIKSKYTLTRKP